MIRSKKYNNLKHKHLNRLFDFDIDCTLSVNISPSNFMIDTVIQSNQNYQLIKEELLDTYILSFNNIIVIHLKEEFISDFEYLYRNSDEYLFEVYYSILPDLKSDMFIKTFHVFCVSKKLGDLPNYQSFIGNNDTDYKYKCLSLFYNSCVIVNNRFDILSSIDKHNAKYKFSRNIGSGNTDKILKDLVVLYINMINSYQEFLPPHYLKI